MTRPFVSLIAAVARNRGIGKDGALLWHLPEDMQRFKRLTSGHPVLMGRKTWDSLPPRFRPLPGRRNVVVTRNPGWRADGADAAASLEAALQLVHGTHKVFVTGGGELYAAALPLADELVLTEVDHDVDADSFFPIWDRALFVETAREARVAPQGWRFDFVTYRRTAPHGAALCQNQL